MGQANLHWIALHKEPPKVNEFRAGDGVLPLVLEFKTLKDIIPHTTE